jgi:hypothetical protein
MNGMIAEFREKNVAHHDRLLARARPAGQTEQRAPITLVDDAIANQVVFLAVIEHRQAHHAGVLHRSPHKLVVLDAMPVIRDRHHARLGEGTDRRQLLTPESFRNRARRQNIDARDFRRAIPDPGNGAWTVGNRRCVRHANDCGEPTGSGPARARFNCLLPTKARLAKMDV